MQSSSLRMLGSHDEMEVDARQNGSRNINQLQINTFEHLLNGHGAAVLQVEAARLGYPD
jgi:hypothetical protein